MAQLGGAETVEGTYAVAITGTVPEDFVKKIKARYDAPIHYAMMMGNDAFSVVKNAVELAQSLDPVAVKDALKKTNYDGLQASGIKFEDFDGYRNQARWAPFIAKWVNGKLVVTWTSEGAVAGSTTVKTETRWLSADGNEMSVETARANKPPMVLVYDKQKK